MSQVFSFAKLARLPEPVLSVYLDVNPVRHVNRNSDHGYQVWFRGQARQLLANRENSERSTLSAVVDRVEHFLEEAPQEHRGLAIFAGPGVWEVVPLAIEPQNELHWGRPVLWPLTAMGTQHPSSCIAVVDQSGVRLFSLRSGELNPLQTLEFRIDPSQWKEMRASHSAERGAGMPHGPQRDLYEHRRESQYLRFLGEAASGIAAAAEANGLSRVVLLGPSRHTKVIEHKLPASVRKRTVHVPHLWREEDAAGSLAGVEEFLRGVEMRRQEARVTELLNRERGIVTGIDETLALLQRGRLASLVAAESFNPALRYCPVCDHAGASSARVCPRCGGEQAEVTLHEILPQLLVRHGCEGELLSGRPAGRLRIAGSMGGWLRYRSRDRVPEAPPRVAAPLAAAGAA